MRLSPVFAVLSLAAMANWLAGCSPALLNVLAPSGDDTVQRDVAFGSDPQQKLDIYVPDGLTKPAPVLIFFYGGSWQNGDKDGYRWAGQAFAGEGIVTVVANYRLYPPALFPSFVEDGALALRYVHDNIAKSGGDPARVFVAGHSAGAYNAIMLASDPKYVRAVGGDFSWIRGVIGIAGPYDFLPMKDPDIIAIFGGANNANTQPINFIDGKRPPMLLVAGTDDKTVDPANVTRMAAKLKANDSEVETRFYPGVGHIGIILSLAPGFRGNTTLREDVAHFIQTH